MICLSLITLQGWEETEMVHKGNKSKFKLWIFCFQIWFINKPFSIRKTHDNSTGGKKRSLCTLSALLPFRMGSQLGNATNSFMLVMKKESKQPISLLREARLLICTQAEASGSFCLLVVLFVFNMNSFKNTAYGLSCSGRAPIQHSRFPMQE